MHSTIPLEELEKYSENIYEAIVVIGKRARQINMEQKRKIEEETGIDDAMDNYDDEDEEIDRDALEQEKVIKFPKPIQLAIQEYLDGKLKFDYGDKLVEQPES